MALTKEVSYDQIEVRGEYKAIHCRKATVIKEDGKEISRAFHRHVLHPSNLSFDPDDGSYIHITTDISGETQEVKERKVMPTEIGENSKFTFDLKFIVTIGAVLVSASATYFSITGKLNEIESNNHPNRMEHELVVNEIAALKGAGDLKIITYKLDQYDDMFNEIKELVKQLSPLAADLEYIKKELDKLKDKEVDIPEVDLSGIELKLDNLSNSIKTFEERLNKLEKNSGGRF